MTNATLPAETAVQTYRYRAMGFTEDINDCDVCGKVELKGTVRMEVVDEDGNVDGEFYAGVVCAARRAGKKAAEIRYEAKAADDAVRAAWTAWSASRSDADYVATGASLARKGLTRNYANVTAVEQDPAYLSAMASWDAANPAPERPRGW